MKEDQTNNNDYDIFAVKSLLWVFFAWLGFLSALAGLFNAWINWIIFLVVAIFAFKRYSPNGLGKKVSKHFLFSSVIILIVCAYFSFTSTPTIFSGRDQGSISEAAVRLAENHRLEFSTPASDAFFKIYGPGKALNFPGFYYTNTGKLIPQFPVPYISWLALFYAPFGLIGFKIANALLLSFFFITFNFLLRFFTNRFCTTIGLIILATSAPIIWIAKFTLTENMAAFLLWSGILATAMLFKKPSRLSYALAFSSLGLLLFTRIEGTAFLLLFFIAILLSKDVKRIVLQDKKRNLIYPCIALIAIGVADFVKNMPFFKEIGKAVLPKLAKGNFLYASQTPLPSNYLLKVFLIYGLIGIFLLALIGVIFLMRSKKWHLLIPAFIAMPTLIYLFNPNISPDHPWMLRRLSFAIIPTAVFYVTILLHQGEQLFEYLKTKKLIIGIFTLAILGANLPAFLYFYNYRENKDLLNQTKELSLNFGENDLILVDRLASGSGWSMISGPLSSLYHKHAAYFFNTKDYKKLDLSVFDNVYLISSQSEAQKYYASDFGQKMVLVKNITLNQQGLDTDTLCASFFPEKIDRAIEGKLFLIKK